MDKYQSNKLYVLDGAAGLVLVVLSSKLLTVIVCLAPVLQEPPSASFHSVLMFMLYRPACGEIYVGLICESADAIAMV